MNPILRSLRPLAIAVAAITMVSLTADVAGQKKPVKTQIINTFFVAPPASLEAMMETTEVVLRLRLEKENPADRNFPDGSPGYIMTKYSGVVLEVLKNAKERAVSAGETISVLQPGGTRDRGTHVVRAVESGFPPLKHGEYVCFLQWHAAFDEWTFAFGPDAVYQIDGAAVNTPGSTKIAKSQRGRKPADFLQALRRSASQR